MTDLTPALNTLVQRQGSSLAPHVSHRGPSPDEFLKEAYRINTHIASLLEYLHQTRPSYLSISTSTTTTHTKPTSLPPPPQQKDHHHQQPLTDTDRDNIDTSTSLLLHDLNNSITTLSSAESLRHETATNLLAKQYSQPALWKWAAGHSLTADSSESDTTKSAAQRRDESREHALSSLRESVLWFLRRRLDAALATQRDMVERRIERVREKEKSVLYKALGTSHTSNIVDDGGVGVDGNGNASVRGKAMDADEVAAIEAQLSPQQLQLFAEENDTMVRYYEETLDKVQNAEKSLLEIAALQQTLVAHLATQEEYVGQLVSDADSTQTNIQQGNRELKRATERRSTAQAVFWGTVGLCTWLVVWDLIF